MEYRRHFLQSPRGFLKEHFEKLIQCDPRLNALCQQPDIAEDFPKFEPHCSAFEGQDESKCNGFNNLEESYGPKISGYYHPLSCSAFPSASVKYEIGETIHQTPDNAQWEDPSDISVTEVHSTKENAASVNEDLKDSILWDQFKCPELEPIMFTSDSLNHKNQCISVQMTSCNPLYYDVSSANEITLDELNQYLQCNYQITSASEEKMLVSKAHSHYSLIQKDPVASQDLQVNCATSTPAGNDGKDDKGSFQDFSIGEKPLFEISTEEADNNDGSPVKQPPPSIERMDSYEDLLLHLPRVASLPQFLYNVKQDGENPVR